MVYKEITQRIIDILKANANLTEPDKIRKYWFGVPKTPSTPGYPYIYVQFDAKPDIPATVSKSKQTMRFRVAVFSRDTREDNAEKDVYDKAEAIEAALKGNRDLRNPSTGLDPLALDSHPIETRAGIPAVEGDYAVAGMIVMLEVVKVT